MKLINSEYAKISMAMSPDEDPAKVMTEIKSITTLTTNISQTVADIKYFQNKGEITKLATGGSIGVSIAIDFDSDDALHQKLFNMAMTRLGTTNNQYILFEYNELQTGKTNYLFGKSVIQFKTVPSSGGPDEIAKIEFDIFPQDDVWTFSETKPNWV